MPTIVSMSKIWNFSNKKWLLWTGFIGINASWALPLGANIINAGKEINSGGTAGASVLFWLPPLILYITCDRKKPKTKNYQIERVSTKAIIILGNIYLFIILLTFLLFFSHVY